MTKARDIADGVDTADIADGAISTAKIADSAITDAKISGMASSKLTGDLPAISGAALTGISAGLSGPNKEIFTSSGTFTVPAGVTSIKVIVVGGGASGTAQRNNLRRQCTAGGGGGGTAIKWITGLTAGDTVAVTIGAGGTGTTSSPYYGNGGTSSFGSYCSATGGQGRVNNDGNNESGYTSSSFGGIGGTATGGDFNIAGGKGGDGTINSGYGNVYPLAGCGGRPMGLDPHDPVVWAGSSYNSSTAFNYITLPSPFGGEAGAPKFAGSGSSTVGNSATGYGCGGSGFTYVASATGSNGAGGDGYQGVVIVEY
jgi:hypothetical protein